MMDRRSMLALAAAMLAGSPAYARQIGMISAGGISAVLDGMGGVVEPGRARVSILVSPGCAKSGDLWRGSRSVAGSLELRWIPCGEGRELGVRAVAAALEAGDASAIRDLLQETGSAETPSPAALDRAREQDRVYDGKVGRLLYEATNKTPAMPTLVFMDASGNERVVRGSIEAVGFTEIEAAMGLR